MDDPLWVFCQQSEKSKHTGVLVDALSLKLLTKAEEILLPSEVDTDHSVHHIHIQLWCVDYGQNKCFVEIVCVCSSYCGNL